MWPSKTLYLGIKKTVIQRLYTCNGGLSDYCSSFSGICGSSKMTYVYVLLIIEVICLNPGFNSERYINLK